MTATPEMVERVARAMWEAQPIVQVWALTWEQAGERDVLDARKWRQFARVAIEAMWEPSEKMVDAYYAVRFPEGDDPPVNQPLAADAWEAMIDAALGKQS